MKTMCNGTLPHIIVKNKIVLLTKIVIISKFSNFKIINNFNQKFPKKVVKLIFQ